MSIVGYARVSTVEQSTDAQTQTLIDAGAERVFVDHGYSSRLRERPQWIACLDYMRRDDVLLVRAIDRLAGTQTLAIEAINDLAARGIHLRSLSEPDIDTTTAAGRALLSMIAVFAQMRVDLIRETTLRGLEHARAHGRVGGRPRRVTPEVLAAICAMHKEGSSYRAIGAQLRISQSSIYRALRDVPRGSDL